MVDQKQKKSSSKETTPRCGSFENVHINLASTSNEFQFRLINKLRLSYLAQWFRPLLWLQTQVEFSFPMQWSMLNRSGEPDSNQARFCQWGILCPKRKWAWCMLESAGSCTLISLPLATKVGMIYVCGMLAL